MKYRQLGRTGVEVSEISLGCSGYWGDKRFSEDSAQRIIHEAFEGGINFFDTGHNYSNFNAEPRLGRILKGLFRAHGRSKFVISSKGGSILGRFPLMKSRNLQTQDFSPDFIEASCKASISNLECEYLDIFQLHGIRESQVTDELIERLRKMKARGMYRFLGVNTHDIAQMEFVSRNSGIFDMILIDYNVIRLDREPMVSRLGAAGIGVVAGTVLAQGHLVDSKIGSIWNGSYFWYLTRSILKGESRALARDARLMRSVLTSIPGMTPSQAAFAFILGDENVSSCVFGTTNLRNCREVLNSSGMVLTDDQSSEIRRIYEKITESK